MITTAFVRTMTSYNAAMNERLYGAAAHLSDNERRRDRGAFWRSIHGTFSHLLWGDRMWMSRFAGWDAPTQKVSESADCYATFDEMHHARIDVDARLIAWACDLSDSALDGDLAWVSGSVGPVVAPRAFLMMHFFNHQTHHRGQAHAMLTGAGVTTGPTDLPFVVPEAGVRIGK